MKILYFDCAAGISGEMLVGAMLDLGCDIHFLAQELSSISFGTEYEITKSAKESLGIFATLFEVKTEENDRKISGSDILKLLSESNLLPSAKLFSVSAFLRILKAENAAKCSNCEIVYPLSDAIKMVVTISSVAILLELFRDHRIIFSPLCEGTGFANASGNYLPTPDPIVSKILSDASVPINITDAPCPLITFEGAAICAEMSADFSLLPPVIIRAVGYGASLYQLDDRPSVLRIISGESEYCLEKSIGSCFSKEKTGLNSFDYGYNMNKDSI